MFDIEALGDPLDGRYAQEVAVDAVDLLQVLLPQVVLRNASLEVVYLEAVAQAVTEVLSGGNEIAAKVVELILSGVHQVPRLPGAAATGDVDVVFALPVTTVIPAGTGFIVPEWGLELVSTADVTVVADDTAVVPVATAEPTGALNGQTPLVDVLDVLADVVSVSLAGPLTGGAPPEDDGSYLQRGRWRLARITTSLVVPDSFAAFVMESGLASNAHGVAAWDGVSTATAGLDEQHVTVVCWGFGGPVAGAAMTALEGEMASMVAVGASVHVVAAVPVSVDVTVTVAADPGYSALDVQASVEAAVQAYLDAHTWTVGAPVRVSSLSTTVDNAPGVDYVSVLAAPSADVVLDVDEAAVAGTITVSVI